MKAVTVRLMPALLAVTVLLANQVPAEGANSKSAKDAEVLFPGTSREGRDSRLTSGRASGWDVSSGSTPPATSLRWYGFYDPVSGAAVEDETWTFDHGAVDPWEGWRIPDAYRGEIPARRITAADWANHGNIPSAPILGGAASLWVGYFEDEACNRGYKGGLGYGNGWCLEIITPDFGDEAGAGASVSFDCFYDVELIFDYIEVLLEQGGARTRIDSLSGKVGSPASPAHLNYAFTPYAGDPFRIVFRVYTDPSFSDADSSYLTDVGPFGLDNVDITGPGVVPLGIAPPYDFESGLQGFALIACPSPENLAGLNDASVYGLSGGNCDPHGMVVEFHDDAFEHPNLQEDAIVSPAVPLPASGGPFNVFAEYDVYTLPVGTAVAWNWAWSYYPVTCPLTGEGGWSEPAAKLNSWNGTFSGCEKIRSFATDTTYTDRRYGVGENLIPAGADSVRFYLRVGSFFVPAPVPNTPWPLFDNIRIGISSMNTVLHVPSPSYGTIQAAIDAADPGDTVLVAAGRYRGAGNRNLSFGGKNLVLLSEEGANATIIDCELAARGITFDSGEGPASVVCGFTIRNGTSGFGGGGILVDGASPVFIDCLAESCSTASAGGGALVDGDAQFFDCRFDLNTADDFGGGVAVNGGSPHFEGCFMTADSAVTGGGGVAVFGGTPTFLQCSVENNESAADGGGVAAYAGDPTFDGCHIQNNTAALEGGGVLVLTGAASFQNTWIQENSAQQGAGVQSSSPNGPGFDACTITANDAVTDGGGVLIPDGNSYFSSCSVLNNTAGGDGGGVAARLGSPEWNLCDISGNEAAAGGGMDLEGGFPILTSCFVSGNSATTGGGILTHPFSLAFIVNTMITGNLALVDGGGIWSEIGQGLLPDVYGCTIADNRSDSGLGGGIYVENNSGAPDTILVTQTIVWGNCAPAGDEIRVQSTTPGSGIRFTCSAADPLGVVSNGTVTFVGGHVTTDPLFCIPSSCTTAPAVMIEYEISDASDCTAANSPCGQLIGAQGIGCPAVDVPVSPGPVPASTYLYQNSPNPFRSSTTIRFDLAEPGRVRLQVFDVAGRLIRVLADGELAAARHAVGWDGRDGSGRKVSKGIYFCRFESKERLLTRKMLILE